MPRLNRRRVLYDDGSPLPSLEEVMRTRVESDPTEWLDFNFPVGPRLLVNEKKLTPRFRIIRSLLLRGSRVADFIWWLGGETAGGGKPTSRNARFMVNTLRRFCRRTGWGIEVRTNSRSARLFLVRPPLTTPEQRGMVSP